MSAHTSRRVDPVAVLRILVAVVLGGIGAAAGFKHTHDWAIANGQAGWLAWADAVVIEGLAVMAGFEIHRDHQHGRTQRRVTFPMAVLVVAFIVQMSAQVALAPRTPAGWLVAAMPALGFLIVVKLLMRHTPNPRPAPTALPPTAAEPVTGGPELPRRPNPPGSVLGKLPATVRQSVTATTEAAHAEGRSVTSDDIHARVSLPNDLVASLVAELNTRINHHPVRATS